MKTKLPILMLSLIGFCLFPSVATYAQLKEFEDGFKKATGNTKKGIDQLSKDAKKEAEHRMRDAQKGLESAKQAVEKPLVDLQDYQNEHLYFAYRNYWIGKNGIRQPTLIRPGSLHYSLIEPVMGRYINIQGVAFYFNSAVPLGMDAITFGNAVYFKTSYDPNNPDFAARLAHELAHSIQYKRLGGEKEFGKRYMRQIGGSLTSPRNFEVEKMLAIHDDLQLEKEANNFEAIVKRRADEWKFSNQQMPSPQTPGGLGGPSISPPQSPPPQTIPPTIPSDQTQSAGNPIGRVTITNDYDNGNVDILLFHPQNPLQVFATWSVNRMTSSGLNYGSGPMTIGGDWGIAVAFGNGVKSRPVFVRQVGSFQNGIWIVRASKIYEAAR